MQLSWSWGERRTVLAKAGSADIALGRIKRGAACPRRAQILHSSQTTVTPGTSRVDALHAALHEFP